MSTIKKAVLFTASGGGISQEAAVIDYLIASRKIHLDEHDTCLISTGSGVLTLLAINACFQRIGSLNWLQFFKEGFWENLNNDDIYLKTDPFFWNTHPFRSKVNKLIRKARFMSFSDLPFESVIALAESNSKKSKWIKKSSKKHNHAELSDIIMAASAIPVVFPSIVINSVHDEPLSVSGGTYCDAAVDGFLTKAKKQMKKLVAENGQLDELFVVSPARSNEPLFLHEYGLTEMSEDGQRQLQKYWDEISLDSFLSTLIELEAYNRRKKLVKNIYVCMPEQLDNAQIFDFSKQEEQYTQVCSWFNKHPERIAMDITQFNINIACEV